MLATMSGAEDHEKGGRERRNDRAEEPPANLEARDEAETKGRRLEEADEERGRKEEAKLRGKEIGRAQALRRRVERERLEQKRERELYEERERQREGELSHRGGRGWERVRERQRNEVVSGSGSLQRHSLLGYARRRGSQASKRDVSDGEEAYTRRLGSKRWKRNSDLEDDVEARGLSESSVSLSPDSRSSRSRAIDSSKDHEGGKRRGKNISHPRSERTGRYKKEELRLSVTATDPRSSRLSQQQGDKTSSSSRVLEETACVGSSDGEQRRLPSSPADTGKRAWITLPTLPSPQLALPRASPIHARGRRGMGTERQDFQPRSPVPLPGNTLAFPFISNGAADPKLYAGPFLRGIVTPVAQGMGTLAPSPVRGVGSGTLAVAINQEKRAAPCAGAGTLAVW